MNQLLEIGTCVLTGIGAIFVTFGLVDLIRPMPKQRP